VGLGVEPEDSEQGKDQPKRASAGEGAGPGENAESVEDLDAPEQPAGDAETAEQVQPAEQVQLPQAAASTESADPADVGEPTSTGGRFRFGALQREPVRIAIAFAASAAATLILLTVLAVTLAAVSLSSGRVAEGVRVGNVDVSGMSRDQVVARLQSAYASFGQGEASVHTPLGVVDITYAEVGRAPDVEVMADSAMSVGHSGNPIRDAVDVLKARVGGKEIPPSVRIDPTAIAKRVRALVGAYGVPAKDAQATNAGGTFTYTDSSTGSGIDEKAVSAEIVSDLAAWDAPSHLVVDTDFVVLQPTISDQQAQAAAAEAPRMAIDLNLVWTGPVQTSSATSAPSATTTFQVDADTVRGWISFGTRTDGTYGPLVDSGLVQTYLAGLSGQVGTAPVEPVVNHDKFGKATSLSGGKDGTGIDLATTTQAIEKYLAGLALGDSPASVAIVEGPPHPTTTLDSLEGTEILDGDKGVWSTFFTPDSSNGNGANIRVPARLLNGIVVAPGEQFSFLKAMGPIDKAHGFALGGLISSGKTVYGGAIGGGICTASTTLFNAVMRAGLQIDERHAHFYYIDRYPVGLDATVFVNSSQTLDFKWTNDTPNPIVIRAYTTSGSMSKIVVQLWSQPMHRTVTLSVPSKKDLVHAKDSTQYTTSLKPGVWGRVELPRDGFDTSVTRIVTDANGKVIHKDRWTSKYVKVDGLKLVGKAP